MNYYQNELYHYGVKGMKWGVRRKRDVPVSSIRSAYDKTKSDYKQKKRDYNKSFNKAYNKSIAAYSPIKKHRQENEQRWNEASKKAEEYAAAKSKYKEAKKDRKEAIKSAHKQINKNASIGSKLLYSDATRKKAAQYIVDNNMPMKDAMSKANKVAIRNTAAILGVYGAMTVASMYRK